MDDKLKKKIWVITGAAIAAIVIICISVVTAVSCRDKDEDYKLPTHEEVMVYLESGEEIAGESTPIDGNTYELQQDTEIGGEVGIAFDTTTAPTSAPTSAPTPATAAHTPAVTLSGELRAVWVPYMALGGVNAAKIDAIIAQCKAVGANAIMLHVRPFGDALYKSSYYPWSHLITGTQGIAPAGGFDPLAYAITKAHENGMQLHAWVNPLRIRMEGGATPETLAANNPYTKFRTDGDSSNDGWVIDYNGGAYFNPGEEGARKYIIDGIAEIAANYNVDGIHWDDYFYPADDASFDDSASYKRYRSSGGTKTLLGWRTDNINALVRDTYSRVKATNSNCIFGISPAGNIGNCLNMGANVYEWCSKDGYVDYICPQVYWAIGGDTDFTACCKQWRALTTNKKIKFYVGLALYKAGSDADNGSWKGAGDMIARQIMTIRGSDIAADGFMLYSYSYLTAAQTAQEMENFKKVL